MAKQLNSTRAIVDGGYDGGEEHTIRSRKIENGWLTNRSTYNCGTGEYKSSETYSKERPRIDVDVKGQRGSVSSALADTKKYMGGR